MTERSVTERNVTTPPTIPAVLPEPTSSSPRWTTFGRFVEGRRLRGHVLIKHESPGVCRTLAAAAQAAGLCDLATCSTYAVDSMYAACLYVLNEREVPAIQSWYKAVIADVLEDERISEPLASPIVVGYVQARREKQRNGYNAPIVMGKHRRRRT